MSDFLVIKTFRTKNLKVVLAYDEDYCSDDYALLMRVRVIHTPSGVVLGEDYIGGVDAGNPYAFIDHYGIRQQGNYGSYFSDMVRNAAREARQTVKALSEAVRHV